MGWLAWKWKCNMDINSIMLEVSSSQQFPVTSAMMKATAQRDEWNKIWQNTRKNDKIWRVLASSLQECFVLRLDKVWWFNDSQTPKTGAMTFIGGSNVTLLQFVAMVPTEWNADIHILVVMNKDLHWYLIMLFGWCLLYASCNIMQLKTNSNQPWSSIPNPSQFRLPILACAGACGCLCSWRRTTRFAIQRGESILHRRSGCLG